MKTVYKYALYQYYKLVYAYMRVFSEGAYEFRGNVYYCIYHVIAYILFAECANMVDGS